MMDHWLTYLNTFLQSHPRSGELFAFLVAFAESLPLIGTIVPGSITMTIIGILVGRNILPFSLTLIAASIGALAGDVIGCWIGKHYNEKLRNMWPFSKHPKWLSAGEVFFKKHGGKSILIGRFVGPVRSTVPLIAGLLRISWPRFFSAAAPSALLWALAYLMPGVLVGAVSLELPPSKTTEFMLAGLAAIVFLWFLLWVIQRSFVLLGDYLQECIASWWLRLKRSTRIHFIAGLITNQRDPEDYRQLTLLIIACISLLCFLSVFTMVITHSFLYHLNEPLCTFFQSLRTHGFDLFFINITMLGKNLVLATAVVLITAGLLFKKQWRSATHLMLITAVSGTCVLLFKHLMYSPRPNMFMTQATSSSFPSGHTLLSVTLIGFMAFLISRQLVKALRWIPYSLATILVLLIGFSRIYLGAHWLTDVLASGTLGLSILLCFIISYRRHQPTTQLSLLFCLPLFLISLSLPWLTYGLLNFKQTSYRFTQYWPEKYTQLNKWWQDPKDFLPIYRMNRFGKATQPFNIQWAAPISKIKKQLTQNDWLIYQEKNNVKSTIRRFSSYKPEQHFPIFPWLYRHKAPELLMIKHVQNQTTIIELRLWQTGIKFKDQRFPLWIGTLNYHSSPEKLISFKKPKDISFTGDGGLSELVGSLGSFKWKKIQIPDEDQPLRVKALDWDGSLLVIRMPTLHKPKTSSHPPAMISSEHAS